MKALASLLLTLTCASSAMATSPQEPPANISSPFPWRRAEYSFHESLTSAINASQGQKKILIYSIRSLQIRNRVPWLMQQRALWDHPLTKKALSGLPVVAVEKDSDTGRAFRIPQFGISILNPSGTKLLQTIDFSTVKTDAVPSLLAELLKPQLLQPEESESEAAEEIRNFEVQRSQLADLISKGKLAAAKTLVTNELARNRDGFGPRLLESTYRHQTIGKGYHASQESHARPVLDVVCIVDNDASFLRALEGWKTGPIYPILFRDNHYLPLFLEAFQARNVVLLNSQAGKTQPIDATRLLQAYATATGGKAKTTSPAELTALWRSQAHRNPGIVLTHPSSPMWPAGLALAAARNQLIAMEAPVTNPSKRVSQTEMLALRSRLQGHLKANHIDAFRLYDELDFVTIASELPFRYSDHLYADRSTYAIDDAIARDRLDFPFAFVGRLMGSREQALYMAMCGLFLTQNKTLLFSRYQKSPPWEYFGSHRAAPILKGKVSLTHIEHPAANLQRWQAMFTAQRNEHDLVHVNSSGSSRNWSTSKGNGSYDDLPLTVPAIVSYVHSNSLGNGYDSDTVGGRWLHNGAYAFFGSTHEPYLDAFVSVFDAYDRSINRSWPIGAAHRLLPKQQRWRPWKLMLFGDPLIRLRFEPAKRQPYQTGSLPGPLTDLKRSSSRNPFREKRLALQLFQIESRAWQGQRDRVAKALPALIRALSRSKQTEVQELRQRLADLIAWSIYAPDGLRRLHRLAKDLHKHGVHSRRLSYLSHALSVSELRTLSSQTGNRKVTDQTVTLLKQHLGWPYSKAMYKRIGELYKPIIKNLDNGSKIRTQIRREVQQRVKIEKNLQAFLAAF
jgi:hypothetical protein